MNVLSFFSFFFLSFLVESGLILGITPKLTEKEI